MKKPTVAMEESMLLNPPTSQIDNSNHQMQIKEDKQIQEMSLHMLKL